MPDATSPTVTGRMVAEPSPTSGRNSKFLANSPILLSSWSSMPMSDAGLTMVAEAKARRTAASPAALERRNADGACADAAMCETCTRRSTPASAAASAIAPARCTCVSTNDQLRVSALMPTRLTTTSAPSTTSRIAFGDRASSSTGTICPRSPISFM
eukprot:Amastigsp_a175131_27.p3 type:complete len:157 gc:universal Amastigsp_a175131_27:745-275(-)